jgi:NADH:ubiquinone oxidoreductase subunit 4 (subunit M)
MQRTFYGKPSTEAPAAEAAGAVTPGVATPLLDLDRREFAILSTLVAVMIWLGLYPRPFFEVSRAPTQALQTLYSPAATPERATPIARVAP